MSMTGLKHLYKDTDEAMVIDVLDGVEECYLYSNFDSPTEIRAKMLTFVGRRGVLKCAVFVHLPNCCKMSLFRKTRKDHVNQSKKGGQNAKKVSKNVPGHPFLLQPTPQRH